MNKQKQAHDEKPYFLDQPKNIRKLLYGFYSICVVLFLSDFVVHRHTEMAIEKLPGFYAFYGFIACVLLVLLATQMRKLVMRKADYYSELDLSESQLSDADDQNLSRQKIQNQPK